MTTGRMIPDAARVLLTCGLLVACLDGETRASRHAEQARHHLEAGRIEAALIELNGALRHASDNADYPEQIAGVLLAIDDAASARFYLGEAYRIDPARESTAVALALLLLGDDPDQAEALLSEVLARNPDSAWGQIGRAEQALVAFDVAAALAAARRAVELEPALPDAHWHLARVYEAHSRERTLLGESTDDETFRAAQAAITRFGELDPTRRWQAGVEHARLLAAWPGHQEEAESALREASEQLTGLNLAGQEDRVLNLAIEFARTTGNPELERWALERKVEIAPRNYSAWTALAELSERQGVPSRGIYLRLIATLPEETEPHIHYARRTGRVERPVNAIAYLTSKIGKGFDDAALLAEIARIQLGASRLQAALGTIEQLENQHPEARQTRIMVAWALMHTGRPETALERLAELDWAHEEVGAQLLLGDVYYALGDPAEALAALERAAKLTTHLDTRSLRARARLLYELGRCREARSAYRTLSRAAALRPADRALLAHCYIETGGRAIGIRMLERLVDSPAPPEAAVHELYVREGGAPEQRERLRSAFAKLLEPRPNHPGVLESLAEFEIAAGSPGLAREPIEASHALAIRTGAPRGSLALLLARLDAAENELDAARERVLGILDDEPTTPGVLEFALWLYPTRDDAITAIKVLTSKGPGHELPASHHALLGRLYHRSGNGLMARWSYEQALNGGLELPILKNDLAFLLAKQHRDLKRAQLLARQAVQSLPDEPGVIDTLGFVMLELGDDDRAAEQFRSALKIAEKRGLPQATIQYHLGLALTKLERLIEAEQAFALALEQGESFSDEAAARHQLARLRGEL